MAKPRKSKTLIPETAKKCNVSEELASDVVDFFYSELSEMLSSMEDPFIRIPILGSVRLSSFKLKIVIEQIKKTLAELDADDFKSMKRYQRLKDRLEELNKAYDNVKNIEDDVKKRKENLGKS